MLDAASGLTEEELREERGVSCGGIAEICGTSCRLSTAGGASGRTPVGSGSPEVRRQQSDETLDEWFRSSHAELSAFVQSLGPGR